MRERSSALDGNGDGVHRHDGCAWRQISEVQADQREGEDASELGRAANRTARGAGRVDEFAAQIGDPRTDTHIRKTGDLGMRCAHRGIAQHHALDRLSSKTSASLCENPH
jgi:hypothetical protein